MYVYSSAEGWLEGWRGYRRTYIRTDEAVMECPRGGIKGIVYTGFTESGDEI